MGWRELEGEGEWGRVFVEAEVLVEGRGGCLRERSEWERRDILEGARLRAIAASTTLVATLEN